MANKVHVKTGDTVVVISGKSKGKKGKVVEVSPKEGKVIVEGVNMISKHVKPKRMGEAGGLHQDGHGCFPDADCADPRLHGHFLQRRKRTDPRGCGRMDDGRICRGR